MEFRSLDSCPTLPSWLKESEQISASNSAVSSNCEMGTILPVFKDVEKIDEEAFTQQLCASICPFCDKSGQSQCIKKLKPDPWHLESYENNCLMFPSWHSKSTNFLLKTVLFCNRPSSHSTGSLILTLELLTPFLLEKKGNSTVKRGGMCIPGLCRTLLSSTQKR